MSQQTTPVVDLEIGGAAEINFNLPVAGARETMTVAGEPPMVETQPTAISPLIEERAITELPLNDRRYTDLALLTSGVTQDPRGLTSSSNSDLDSGGIRGYQSSYLVDGATITTPSSARLADRTARLINFSNEVVQEFRVSSNTYGADLGRAGGAVVDVATKSGCNHLHHAVDDGQDALLAAVARDGAEPLCPEFRARPWCDRSAASGRTTQLFPGPGLCEHRHTPDAPLLP
jgi:hypothetical protein